MRAWCRPAPPPGAGSSPTTGLVDPLVGSSPALRGWRPQTGVLARVGARAKGTWRAPWYEGGLSMNQFESHLPCRKDDAHGPARRIGWMSTRQAVPPSPLPPRRPEAEGSRGEPPAGCPSCTLSRGVNSSVNVHKHRRYRGLWPADRHCQVSGVLWSPNRGQYGHSPRRISRRQLAVMEEDSRSLPMPFSESSPLAR